MFKSEVMKSRRRDCPSRLNTTAPEIAVCCQIMQRDLHVVKSPGDLPSMLRAGYKSLRRLRKEMLNCLCVFEVPRLHLLSPDSNDNEQYACLAAPIADFSGLSSRILKSYCVNCLSLDLVLQDWSMSKKKEVAQPWPRSQGSHCRLADGFGCTVEALQDF